LNGSPIEQLLKAIDELDVDAAMALAAPDIRFLMADGRHGEGTTAVRDLISEFVSDLRSTTHRITAQWHQDNVWIAELEASYELRDYLQLKALPRAVVVRVGPDGIADLRVYGAHERPLMEHRTGEEGMWVGGRWVPPL
jgi:SnoaL-like domain